MASTTRTPDAVVIHVTVVRSGRPVAELLGCRLTADLAITVAHPFSEYDAATVGRLEIRVRQAAHRVSGGARRDEARSATMRHLDPERGVAVLALEAPLTEAPLADLLLAERDPVPGDSCVLHAARIVEPNASGSSGSQVQPMVIVKVDAEVRDAPESSRVLVMELRGRGFTPTTADIGAPVTRGNQLVGLVRTVASGGTLEMVRASAIREALAARAAPPPPRPKMRGAPNAPPSEIVPQDAQSVAGAATERDEGAAEPSDAPPLDRAAVWGRLSVSSRRAFRHADSLRTRDGKSRVHMEHLLLGLHEKHDGPTRTTLAAAGIDSRKLRARLEAIAEHALPPYPSTEPPQLDALPRLSRHVEEAVRAAITLADANGSREIQSRHLFVGALSIRRCGAIRWLLEEYRVDPSRIALGPAPVAASPAAESPPVGQAPVTPPVVDAPARAPVAPDVTPTPSLGPGGLARMMPDLPEGDDLFDVEREANAICDVIAARDTEPPLSIGLFGDWGTGKSFFMELMNERIRALKLVAREKDSAFCKHIVQLRFNAWHYMDTDLWASLTAEIFEGLGRALEDDEKLRQGAPSPDVARVRLLGETAHLRAVVTQAERQRDEAAAALRASHQQTEALLTADRQLEARLAPAEIARAVARAVTTEPAVQTSIDRAVEKLGIPEARAISSDFEATLLGLRGVWGRVRATWLVLRSGSHRLWVLTTLAILLALVATWRVIEYADLLSAAAQRSMAALASLVALAAPFLVAATKVMRVIGDAQAENARIVEAKRKEEADRLQGERQQIQARLAEEDEALARARAQLTAAEASLKALSADERMNAFVRERQASTEYTRHFGVIARARHDFERLSELLDAVSERKRQRRKKPAARRPAQLTAGLDVPRIDRIILYIDDLDRCPEAKVVDVLQAVHLLLAFPLFIVVVGVDSRWLLHSLRRHSTAFQPDPDVEGDGIADDEDVHWQSTPFNYLEKIFQIPFNLRPMQPKGFRDLVDILTRSEPASGSGNGAGAPPADVERVPDARTASVAADGVAADPVGTTGAAVAPPTPAPPPSAGTAPAVDLAPAAGAAASGEPVGNAAVVAHDGDATPDPSIEPHPRYLEISTDEREFMHRMHPLIPTPRAAKRYVNVYRLMRALAADEQQRSMQSVTSGARQRVLLLIAILTGFPQEGTTILRELLRPAAETGWWDFVDRVIAERIEEARRPPRPPRANGRRRDARATTAAHGDELPTDERLRLQRWQDLQVRLADVRALVAPSLGDAPRREEFAAWAQHVARYSFEAGRVVSA